MLDELFDDHKKFIKYFRVHDNKALRKQLLTTDKLRYWYCAGVADREDVWQKLESARYIFVYCVNVKNRRLLRKRAGLDTCNWRNKVPCGVSMIDIVRRLPPLLE